VTHDLSEARQMGRRIALVREGRLDALGTADDLLRRPPTVFAANFFGAVNLYRGDIEARDGEMRVIAGSVIAPLPGDLPAGQTMHLMIHPDEVMLVAAESADRTNLLRGEVIGLIDEGSHVAVQLKVEGLPAPLIAYVSRHIGRSHMLELGKSVAADVAGAIHVMRS
jgi:putative spermidine/putrescine transport system ATP-binding protein